VIDEQLVAESILSYMKKEKISIALNYVKSLIFPSSSASSIGDILDLAISISLCELDEDTTFRKLLEPFFKDDKLKEVIWLDKKVPKIEKIIGTSHRELLKDFVETDKIQNLLIQTTRNQKNAPVYLTPSTMDSVAHADGFVAFF